ncbi:MAG: hypothetical protein JNK82_45875 [Myxococcaceae bacterium]|nr:hypothetical protein [Myxococcaceae bacterium]
MRIGCCVVLLTASFAFAAAPKAKPQPKVEPKVVEPRPQPPPPEPTPTPVPAPEAKPAPRVEPKGGPAEQSLEEGKQGERPWAKGVSDAEQRTALALFKDGNTALKEPNFPRAVAKYREALGHWDHPAIHYNLALALLNLDQPVETHEAFDRALKYGAAPLDADKFEQANRYKALLEKQLAGVDIRCNMEGATVKLDGKVLYVAPGRYTGLTTAGPHSIVATKEGYITNELSLPLPAGETKVFELNLMTTDDLTEYKRLWPQYVPYTVIAAGLVVAVAGLGMHFGSGSMYKSFDGNVSQCQQDNPFMGGCRLTPELAGQRTSADILQGTAIAAYVAGGVVAAVGIVLLYLNRLQPYRITVGVGRQGAASTFSWEFP